MSGHRDTGRTSDEDRAKRGDVATSPGMTRIYSHHQKLGRGKKGLYAELSEGPNPENILIWK